MQCNKQVHRIKQASKKHPIFLKETESHISEIIYKMKCQQKLCQRTKNLKPSGNCNVCENAIVASTKTMENNPKKLVEPVEMDLKLMISTHEKLLKGETLERDVVNVLLLGGIINILNQHDRICEIEKKVKAVEVENVTNKCRIESLESWVMKQDDIIKVLDERLKRLDENGVIIKENSDIDEIKKNIIGIELEMSSIKNKDQRRMTSPDLAGVSGENVSKKSKKCKICAKTFWKTSDFENHMVDEHDVQKSFECESCGKTFLLEWRLRKHSLIHTEKSYLSKYFQNNQLCPFEQVGCMFTHSREANNEQDLETVETDDDEEDFMPNENQCHLCKHQLTTKDDLWEHVEANRTEYFEGMLEFNNSFWL